jgi:hypothetical protein
MLGIIILFVYLHYAVFVIGLVTVDSAHNKELNWIIIIITSNW